MIFIVVVGVAVAGILLVLDKTALHSVDPLIRKQALAIAEGLLEEVELMPFTYCDPDDANADAATGAFVGGSGCASTVEALGPEAGESRYSTTAPFDNVNDYNGFCMGPNGSPACSVATVSDLDGNSITGLEAYTASVTVAQQALGTIPAAESLLITVTVTGPSNTTVKLDGYRVRYAPNALP